MPRPTLGWCSWPCHPHRQVPVTSPDEAGNLGRPLFSTVTPALQPTCLLHPTHDSMIFTNGSSVSFPTPTHYVCLGRPALAGPCGVCRPYIRPCPPRSIPGHRQAFAYGPFPCTPFSTRPLLKESSALPSPDRDGLPLWVPSTLSPLLHDRTFRIMWVFAETLPLSPNQKPLKCKC